MPEDIAELQNDAKLVSDIAPEGEPSASGPVPTMMDVSTVQTDNEMDRETLLALGSIREVGKVTIPTLTCSDLVLFELFCPDLLETEDVRRADVEVALYILHCGPDDLTTAYDAILARESLDEVIAVSLNDPDHLAVWLEARQKAGKGMARLRTAITTFGRQLPPYDAEAVAHEIREVLDKSLYGFAMIPKTGGLKKKPAEEPSTENGWARWSRPSRLSRLTSRLKSCGSSLWPWSVK